MKIIYIVLAVLFIGFLLCQSHGAKVLGVFPMVSKSHYILGRSLMRGLAEKGHDVTVISPFGEKNKPKNGKYQDILLTGFLEFKEKSTFNFFDFENMGTVTYQIFMNFMGNTITEMTLNHTNVQSLLKSNEKFDVVIVEQFVNDALKGFAYHFNAHLILLSTFASNSWINHLVGNPAPPSYIAEQTITFTNFDFCFRLKNILAYIVGQLNLHLVFYPQQNALLKKYIPGAPDLSAVIYNASLILLNSHISTNQPVPRVPNMIDIGGYHIEPSKKLPKDLQDFLDNAQDGVIYFSMGSNLKSASFPPDKRDALLRAFSKLKQKVLWKWEDDKLPGQPANVKLGKWLPQQDILAHPNVKLFITHGGLLSLIETIYHGVPVLAIPIFGDQKANAVNLVWSGYGLALPYTDLTEERIIQNLNEILNNPQYRENVKKRSKIFHDRPVKPLDLATYWVEYIIRQGGGHHLKVAGLDMAWYQYLDLDVFIFIVVVIYSVFHLLKLFMRKCVCQKLCKNKTEKTKKS